MRGFDLSPLFRSTVGFDRLADLLDSVSQFDAGVQTYPPYNIERTDETHYRISLAVAGFGEKDLAIETREGVLTVQGRREAPGDASGKNYLYQGIAGRAFERRFQLADYIKVNGAQLVNGLLHVELVREVPEAKRPRTIKVERAANASPSHAACVFRFTRRD